jgi:hypothetical protein
VLFPAPDNPVNHRQKPTSGTPAGYGMAARICDTGALGTAR